MMKISTYFTFLLLSIFGYANEIHNDLNITERDIKVKKIFEIVSDNSSYKMNCKIHKRLDALIIKKFFLHARKEDFSDIISSNQTLWSGCLQEGEILIKGKLYKFELNLGGFVYIYSKNNKFSSYSCYTLGCPELENFEYSLVNINNSTYKSLYLLQINRHKRERNQSFKSMDKQKSHEHPS